MNDSAVDEVIAFVAGWALERAPIESVQPFDVGRHLATAVDHRLVGVVHASMLADELVVDEPDAVFAAHEQAMAEALLLEDMMLVAVDALAEADVDSRVLKGAALAHTLGPDPAERTFGDTDLLVRGDQLTVAAAVLQTIGASRAQAGISADFERRFAKSVTLRWRAGTELDLHRTLAPGPFGLMIRPDELFRQTVTFEVAGRQVATLVPEMHLVHAAIHVALGDIVPRLGNVRDIALLLGDELDLDLVMRTIEGWSCAAPVAVGLRHAASIGAAGHPLLDWAESYRPTSRERRLLTSYSDRRGRFRSQAWASFTVLGWRDRMAFGSAVARRDWG